jgi:hypothetical protein
MKSHMGGGITLCAKNHYGSLIRLPTYSGYYDLHKSLAFMSAEMGSYRALVDIMGHQHLGGKTVLFLVNGLYAGNHNNDTIPHKWPVAPFNGEQKTNSPVHRKIEKANSPYTIQMISMT